MTIDQCQYLASLSYRLNSRGNLSVEVEQAFFLVELNHSDGKVLKIEPRVILVRIFHGSRYVTFQFTDCYVFDLLRGLESRFNASR